MFESILNTLLVSFDWYLVYATKMLPSTFFKKINEQERKVNKQFTSANLYALFKTNFS